MDATLTLRRAATRGRAHLWIRGLCAAALVACVPATQAASEPSLITGQKKSFGYSWQQEMQLGAEADQEVTQTMGVYDNPELQAYVEGVGQRVLQQSQFNDPNAPEIYRNTKFTFRVIDSPVVNAFALPGGFVYVTRGLLATAENEAQLAVVLGHEIAHVAARHSSQQARRSQWTQLGVIAGAILGQKILGEKAPNLAPTILQAGGKAAELFLLRYSREAENESDELGMSYAMRAGYAGEQSARLFEALQRLSAAEGETLPTWQSSHPDPGDRAQRVMQLAAAVPQAQRTNVGEEQYLRHIENIVVGENPREGYTANGVFYHPDFRIQMPVASGWKVDNQRAAFVMAEPGGRGMLALKLAPGTRARDAALQFAQQSKVQITASGDTAVNGLPTTVIIGQGNTDEGAVGVWNAFVEKDGRVFSLLGYAPQAAFEQMRPTFETVAAGFSPLRDERMAAAQPARLKLVRADRDAPFASFVPTALPPDMSPDEVAILNQVALNAPVQQGQTLKIPEGAQQPAAPAAAGQTTPYPVYGQQPATYPNSNPPAQSYPQNYPPQNYPQSTTYPGNTPPSSSPYPNQTGYPANQPYPPSGYPQNHPQSTYPQQRYPQQGYPQQGYPSSQSGAGGQPQAGYPQYPSSSPQPAPGYPSQNYPQFPQPNSNPNAAPPPPSQPQPPVWPR